MERNSEEHDLRKFDNPENFQQYYANHLVKAADSMFARKSITLQARSHTRQQLLKEVEKIKGNNPAGTGSIFSLVDTYAHKFGASMAKACFYRFQYPVECNYGKDFEDNFEFLTCKMSSVIKAIDDRASNPSVGTIVNPNTGDYFFTVIANPSSLREFFINDLLRSNLVYGCCVDLEVNLDLNLSNTIDEYGYVITDLERMGELCLCHGLLMLAEDEKISGELSLIGKNEDLFESTFNKHAPDKGLRQLIPFFDRLIDECAGFDDVRKYGVADLHRAKARSSLKRAVNAYYNHQVFGTSDGHIKHFLGINPTTGMEYFAPYPCPNTIHQHFINNILQQEKELNYSSIENFNKKYQAGQDNALLETQLFEDREICSFLCALAENEKEKYKYTLLRGYLGKINDAVQNLPLEQAQEKTSQIMGNALSSYGRIEAVTSKKQMVSIIRQAMQNAVETAARSKQTHFPQRQTRGLRLIVN